jgi:hypothetical protein
MMRHRECPHPGLSYRRGLGLEDAADHGAILEHVEIVRAPFPGGYPAYGYSAYSVGYSYPAYGGYYGPYYGAYGYAGPRAVRRVVIHRARWR